MLGWQPSWFFISLHTKDGTVPLKCPRHCIKFMQFFKTFQASSASEIYPCLNLLLVNFPLKKGCNTNLFKRISIFSLAIIIYESGANFLGFTVLWPFIHNFPVIFSIICLRPDLYWSWRTTVFDFQPIWLKTGFLYNQYPWSAWRKKDQWKFQ